jgi:ammonia channel protein AmtB
MGLIGAILAGTLCAVVGFADSISPLEAILIGAAGAVAVTFGFQKVLGNKLSAAPRQTSGRSYTSYKSRMGK